MGALQQMIAAVGSGGSVIVPPLLDTITFSPWFAGSLRKLRAAYSGNAVEIRRGGDNATANIGFTAGGDFDTAAAIAHANGGNGNAYISKVYDQSTTANSPFAQATAGVQPQIIASGVALLFGGSISRPAWFHNGTYLTLAGSLSQPMMTNCPWRFTGVGINATLYSDNSQSSVFMSAAGVLAQYAGAAANFKSGLVVGDVGLITELKNGASSKGRWNQVETSTNPGTNGINSHSLGATISGTVALGGYCPERIIYNGTPSSAQMLVMEQNQQAYYGT